MRRTFGASVFDSKKYLDDDDDDFVNKAQREKKEPFCVFLRSNNAIEASPNPINISISKVKDNKNI
jgi:hypothetical protein